MNNITKLKNGQAIPLFSNYQIRLIQGSDLSAIKVMLSDPKVNEYLFFAPAPEAVYEGYFNPMIDDIRNAMGEGRWADNLVFIVVNEADDFVGMIGLTQVAFLSGNYEIGFQSPQKNWGKGITSHACALVSQLAFEQLGAHKISADCYASNQGSSAVLLKSGYLQEGVAKEYYKTDQGFEDKLYFGLNKK